MVAVFLAVVLVIFSVHLEPGVDESDYWDSEFA